jgi:uncharacterized protein YndB with AHSA1/START domain
MTRTIEQHAAFRAPVKVIFDLYLASKKHAAATGAPAKLTRKAGGDWYAHGGAIHGTTLLIIPGRLIVQSWRAKHWEKEEISTLILHFGKTPGGGTLVHLVHAGVPPHDQKGVRQGWPKY